MADRGQEFDDEGEAGKALAALGSDDGEGEGEGAEGAAGEGAEGEAEEGEAAKGEAEGAEGEGEGEAEGAEPVDLSTLSDKIDQLLSDKPAGEAPKEDDDEDDEDDEGLTHEDPVVRKLAREGKQLRQENKEFRERETERETERQLDHINRVVAGAKEHFTVEGNRFTDAHAKSVLVYMRDNPEAAQVLTFGEVARRVLPGLQARDAKTTVKRPSGSPSSQRRTAQPIHDAAGGGASQQKPFAPGPGKDFDDISDHILDKVLRVRR